MDDNEYTDAAPAGLREHPLRRELTNEIHARPAPALRAPFTATRLALLTGDGAAEADRRKVAALCRRYAVGEPPPDVNFWHVELDGVRFNWERHTEFSTYTFIRSGSVDAAAPFALAALAAVPDDWLQTLGGELLVAIHVALLGRGAARPDEDTLRRLFGDSALAVTRASDGAATVWTDFRLDAGGFSRFLAQDHGLTPRQAGRLLQRLFEIETYRMMALLALPLARRIGIQVGEADKRLATLAEHSAQGEDGFARQQRLFAELSALAAEIERLAAVSSYRFSASRAYGALVTRRLDDLREQRVTGRPTIREFLQRRLEPALQTCVSVNERLEALSGRVARASDLLRTRVDLALERQNRDLLESMNRRAAQQLRLQQTVEGLSVVVLSYYLVGLLSYLFKGVKAYGGSLDPDRYGAVAVPLVALTVWLGLRYGRRRWRRAPKP